MMPGRRVILPELHFNAPPWIFLNGLINDIIHIQCDVVVRNAHFVAGTDIDIVIRALFVDVYTRQVVWLKLLPAIRPV